MTWPEFVEWLMGSVLLHGNAVAAIELDGAGRPVSLQPIPWPSLSPVMLPSGKLAFDVVAGNGTQTRRISRGCLFLKDRSDDGWLDRSRIGRAPDVLGAAIGLQTYSTAIWSNAATPSGMLELPAGIDKDGLRRLSEHFDQVHAGAANGERFFSLIATRVLRRYRYLRNRRRSCRAGVFPAKKLPGCSAFRRLSWAT